MKKAKKTAALFIEIPPIGHRFCECCRRWVPRTDKKKAFKGWKCLDCSTVKK